MPTPHTTSKHHTHQLNHKIKRIRKPPQLYTRYRPLATMPMSIAADNFQLTEDIINDQSNSSGPNKRCLGLNPAAKVGTMLHSTDAATDTHGFYSCKNTNKKCTQHCMPCDATRMPQCQRSMWHSGIVPGRWYNTQLIVGMLEVHHHTPACPRAHFLWHTSRHQIHMQAGFVKQHVPSMTLRGSCCTF